VGLHKFLVILTISLVTILVMVTWFLPSRDDFRAENPFWNGTKDINSLASVSPLESLSDLPPSPEGVTLILTPYLDFTPTELEQLNNFVTEGGTLVLADDYGTGNQVLEYLGLKARFSGQVLLDPLFNYKNKWFPRVIHLESTPLTNNIESLVLNHATCLTNVETDNVLALSSSFSFLDPNDNQKQDDGEPTGPLPIVSHHNLGNGQVILVSDPSIFINSMEKIESNYSFIQNLAAITTSELLLDQSHLPPSALHQTKNILARAHAIFITPAGTLGIVIVALTITLMPIWRKRGDNNDQTAR